MYFIVFNSLSSVLMQLEAEGFGRLLSTGGCLYKDVFFKPVPKSLADDCAVLMRHDLTVQEYINHFFKMAELDPTLKSLCLEEHPQKAGLCEFVEM